MFDILARSRIFKLHSYNSKYRREMNGIKHHFWYFRSSTVLSLKYYFLLTRNFAKIQLIQSLTWCISDKIHVQEVYVVKTVIYPWKYPEKPKIAVLCHSFYGDIWNCS